MTFYQEVEWGGQDSGDGPEELLLCDGAEGLNGGPSVVRTEPREQGFETLAIFVTNGDESQAEAVATFNVTNDSICVYSTFRDQKIEFGGHARLYTQMRRLDE